MTACTISILGQVPDYAIQAADITCVALLVLVAIVRVPTVFAAFKRKPRTGTRTAPLLNSEVLQGVEDSSRWTPGCKVPIAVCACSIVMCGLNLSLLVLRQHLDGYRVFGSLLQQPPPPPLRNADEVDGTEFGSGGLPPPPSPISLPPPPSPISLQSEVTGFPLARALMWGLCTGVVVLEWSASRYPGRSLRLWLLLALAVEIARVAKLAAPPTRLEVTADYISVATTAPALVLALVALFAPDTPGNEECAYVPVDDDGLGPSKPATPSRPRNFEATASFFSKLTFTWLSPLLALGASRPLEHSDMYELQTRDAGDFNARKLSRAWTRRAKTPGMPATMLRAWHDAFGLRFWVIGLIELLAVSLQYTQPIFVNLITSYVAGQSSMCRVDAYLCCAGITAASVLQSFANNMYGFNATRLAQNVWVSIGQMVYAKALKLDYEQRERFGIGKIVSYMQVDAGKLAMAVTYIHLVWACPLQLVIAVVMLNSFMGLPGLTAVVIFGITTLPVFVAGKANTKFVMQVLERRDKRVKFASELLSAMRMLKQFAWEAALLKRLEAKRVYELGAIFKSLFVGAFFSFIFNLTPIVASAGTFAVYVASGHELTPRVAFTALTLFGLVRVPFIQLPLVMNGVVDIIVVNKRLTRYFNAPERAVRSLDDDGSRGPDGTATSPLPFEGHYVSRLAPLQSGPPALEMCGCTLKWPAVKKVKAQDDDAGGGASCCGKLFGRRWRADDAEADEVQSETPTLAGIDLSIAQGTVVGVAGPVGCGKSSLLMALLGDMPRLSGRVVVRGKVSICVQEPWIQNATLKDNVLFGMAFNEPRYKMVLEKCALQADLAALPAGDQTEIGERGVNLSGGQKARIALARACYADASVFLFDDILAAVDQQTGRKLMHDVILGMLKERGATVVLATHHVQWLPACDHVVLLDGGKITAQGPPGTLTLPTLESAAPAA
eukprot:CAMPEP_0174706310 /NCGR_PEP_ID=MMETSP1094-20130205/9208_1 /TAXON_ID=156173 /ORGANISM="Chrysochromulina brevifilum, Strain UTEX LB 985" /LENGTH=950 /DNA_ID=CAMNT_0015904565 /DNA_START=44 /DNA_END=2892 /DNA_ORIENTATION=+